MADRILWLVKSLGRGGAERLLSTMAPRVDSARFEIEVGYLLPSDDALANELRTAGVRTVCLDAQRSVELGWLWRLRKLLRDGRYDVIHTHSPLPAAAARVLAPADSAFVHTEHSVWERYRWPTFAVNAATYGRNSAAIAVSDAVATSIEPPRWLPRPNYPGVQVLLHGVNLDDARIGADARTSARAALRLDSDTPLVGNVANLRPIKDHATLIQAVDLLRQRVPDVVVLVIGSGPLAEELQADVERRSLASNVRLLGARSDVLELLPALDAFVLSSRYEGLPISMLEAMACEIPCVLTSVGGIPEVIVDGREGLLVPPGDPASLATALADVLTDARRRVLMGRAAGERVRADFSIDRAVRAHEILYETILSGP